jgi:hypothetical protein
MAMKKFLFGALGLTLLIAIAMGGCSRTIGGSNQSSLLQIAQSRGLSPDDAARAVKTFVPPG